MEELLARQGEKMFYGDDSECWITYAAELKAATGKTVITGKYRSLDDLWSELIVTDDGAWEQWSA